MRAIDGRVWLILPAALLLTVAFLVPVGWLLSSAFTFPEPGLQNFVLLWERPVYMHVMMNTLMISAIVTPVTVLLAFPVAHLMAHGSARLRRWLIFLVLVPFWTSLLVRAFATAILLQRHGVINSFLISFGIIEEPLPLLYNMTGLLAGCVQVLLPFVIFPLYSSMARIDPAYMHAAATLGASPVRAFLRVYLPLTLPGLMTGATLVFISTLGYYIIPALLGGARQQMISQLIQDQIAAFGNWGVAGALSLVLLAITGAMVALLQFTVGLREIAR
jgi:putative spermidine/putrescine transport system permease protein